MMLINQTFPLFKPPYALYFFACSFLHFGTFCVAGGMAMFLPEILNRMSKHEGAGDLRVCDVLQLQNEPSNNATREDYVRRRSQILMRGSCLLYMFFFLQVCDDSVNGSVFIDSLYVGIGYLIGFSVLALTIKSLGRRKIFGLYLSYWRFSNGSKNSAFSFDTVGCGSFRNSSNARHVALSHNSLILHIHLILRPQRVANQRRSHRHFPNAFTVIESKFYLEEISLFSPRFLSLKRDGCLLGDAFRASWQHVIDQPNWISAGDELFYNLLHLLGHCVRLLRCFLHYSGLIKSTWATVLAFSNKFDPLSFVAMGNFRPFHISCVNFNVLA